MKINAVVYLADQNPHRDRSLGITRMTGCLLSGLINCHGIRLTTITSKSSYSFDRIGVKKFKLPWATDNMLLRFATDNFHSIFLPKSLKADIYYYPKGYLPVYNNSQTPKVITIHDTILQFYIDNYKNYRSRLDYSYWNRLFISSIKKADMILTVSNTSRRQILNFCEEINISFPKIIVTYEASEYEALPIKERIEKSDYALHLASRAPHKKTLHLLKWWSELSKEGTDLPELKLVGAIPQEAKVFIKELKTVSLLPHLKENEFVDTIRSARTLILPSEIEGFGLPAIEAYYLGTPVCFVAGTSVDEVIGDVTDIGKFILNDRDSFVDALNQTLALHANEVLRIGNEFRVKYSKKKFAAKVKKCFQQALDAKGL